MDQSRKGWNEEQKTTPENKPDKITPLEKPCTFNLPCETLHSSALESFP
jgi:hypothetical protein